MSRPASAACHTPSRCPQTPLPLAANGTAPRPRPPPLLSLRFPSVSPFPSPPLFLLRRPPVALFHLPANPPSTVRHPRPVICGLSNSPRELFSFAKLEFPPPFLASSASLRQRLWSGVHPETRSNPFHRTIFFFSFSPLYERYRTFSFGDGSLIRTLCNAVDSTS